MFKLGKIVIAVFLPVTAIFFTIRLTYAVNSKNQETTIISPLPQASVPNLNPQLSENNLRLEDNENSFKNGVNILLLGLDGRRGDKNPRCDAIQLVSFNFENNKVLITSIPRGTEVTTRLAGEGNQTNYLSNWCHFLGADFAPSAVEKITGIKPDYTLKLGFSQALGILRAVNLPTTPALQFLRNRSYGIGDLQRSRNQAQFIKDLLIGHLELANKLPNILKYIIYQMVETDIPFEKALSLFDKISSSEILKNPNNIVLATKPNPETKLKELHFRESNYKDGDWQKDKEFKAYQNNLEAYLENLISKTEKLTKAKNYTAAYQLIKTPFSQEIWLQIEDSVTRDNFHLNLLSLYVKSSPEKADLSSQVLDFITEMETAKKDDYKKRGEELLNYVLAQTNT